MSAFEPETLAPPLPSELVEANEERGEVSILLGGMELVLRPSHDAIRRIEAGTKKNVVQLAMAAENHTMLSDEAAIVVTAMIRAWGGPGGKGANADKVGRLIYDAGLIEVLPRLSMVLQLAATGGCSPDGKLKAGELTAPATTGEVVGAASQEPPPPPSDGPPISSGKRRRTSSSPRTKRGSS